MRHPEHGGTPIRCSSFRLATCRPCIVRSALLTPPSLNLREKVEAIKALLELWNSSVICDKGDGFGAVYRTRQVAECETYLTDQEWNYGPRIVSCGQSVCLEC